MWHGGGRPAEPPIAHTSGVFWFLFHAEKELAPQGETLQDGRPQAAPTKGEERSSPRRAKPYKVARRVVAPYKKHEQREQRKTCAPWYPVRLPGGKISPKTAPGPMREGIKSKKAAQRPPKGGVETSGRSKNANFSRNFTGIFQGNPPL